MRNSRNIIFVLSIAVLAAVSLSSYSAHAEGEVHTDVHDVVEGAVHDGHAENIVVISEDGTAYAGTAHDIDSQAHHDHGQAHHDHGDAGHHEEIKGLPQLDFKTYAPQIFWLFISFVVLYTFFSRKTLPEISSAVETRREKIEGDLDNAKDLKEQADKALNDYEAALQEARLNATQTFKAAEDEIKTHNNNKLERFKERAAKLTQETEASLLKAKAEAMNDTEAVAAEIASIAAEKIVGVSTDAKQVKTLIKNISRKAA